MTDLAQETHRRRQSVLIAGAMAAGSQSRNFDSEIGLEFGVDHHRFDGLIHSVSTHDEERLREVVRSQLKSVVNFWSHFAARATEAGSRLLAMARSCRQGAPLDAWPAVTDAFGKVAPFVVATPILLPMLRAEVADGGADTFVSRPPESDPLAAVRNGYRLALEVANNEAATEVFVNTTAAIAWDRVKKEFPELEQSIRTYLDDFGWLHTQGQRYEPLSAESLLYRIQLALLRWPGEAIGQAARLRTAAPRGERAAPSEPQGRLNSILQAMLSDRSFGVDICLQAECIARPFFSEVAQTLGCSTEHVVFATDDEVVAALSHQGELPIPDIERRLKDGFTVQRDQDAIVVTSGGAGSNPSLSGMTACRGVALGRVKIILDQEDLYRLEVGDVLVTAASTIDPTDTTGEGTVFPTRRGGPRDDALARAAAVVADEGGLLSHAAIVCRERGLPAVLGTERATSTLVEGQVVEVDATKPVGTVSALGSSR